jgi:transposase
MKTYPDAFSVLRGRGIFHGDVFWRGTRFSPWFEGLIMTPISTSTHYYGCDVSKSNIAVASGEDNSPITSIGNHRKAICAWLDRLPENALIGMEATGRYHEMLANCAVQRGYSVFVINPKQLSLYAKGIGQRGKTDPLDARMISRYLQREGDHLHPYTEPTVSQCALRNLLTQRANLVKHRQSIRLCLQETQFGVDAAVKRAQKTALGGIDRLIKQIDAQLHRLVQENPLTSRKSALLQTISGIGPLNSAALTHRLDRTAFQNSDALVAAYGLDPRPKDSGNKTGRRQLTKQGNAEDRRLIYLAALSAAKTTTFKPIYRALRAKGFATSEAIVILARKLLRIAFAVWTTNQPFDPTKVGSQQQETVTT